jgi:orotidine-5'-phosphate decarboxylase
MPDRCVPERIEDRLIVALDVPTVAQARALVERLDGVVSFFKLGLWLIFAAGFDRLLDELAADGKQIFPVLCSMRHQNKIAGGPITILLSTDGRHIPD